MKTLISAGRLILRVTIAAIMIPLSCGIGMAGLIWYGLRRAGIIPPLGQRHD